MTNRFGGGIILNNFIVFIIEYFCFYRVRIKMAGLGDIMDNENKEPLCEENGQTESQTTPSLSKAEEKAARKERMRKKRLQRRIRRNARIARGRHFKNFLIWLSGFLFLPLAIAGASFIVPISVITGNNGDIVSTELSRRSMFEAVRYVAGNINEFGFADFPIIGKSLSDLQKTQIGEKDDGEGGKTPITLGDLVYIDVDKLNTIKFKSGNFSGEVTSCIEVVATIESLGGASALGDFGGLSVFTEEEEAGTVAAIDTSAEGFDAKEYYYKTSDLSSLYSAGDTEYKRAYNDDGSLVDALNDLSDTDKTVFKLYYPPLEKVKLSELKDILGNSVGRTTVKSLLTTLGGENETLTDIVGEDTTIKGLKDFEINDVALNTVLPAPDGDNPTRNKKIYDILRDSTGVTGDTDEEKNANIKIGDLSNIETDNIKLNTVLPAPDGDNPTRNKKLYDILRDAATGVTGDTDEEKNANLTVGNLSTFTSDNIRLNTVMGDVSGNKVLSALKEKDITVGEIGAELNNLSLYEVYGNSAFVEITMENPAPLGARTFNKGIYHDDVHDVDKVCFDYDEYGNGAYYLDKTAGIWLILCYDTVTYNPDESVNERFSDAEGNPTKYIADNLTIGDLSDGNSFSKKFRNATLKQLIDTRLVDGDALGGGSLSAKTQALSLQDIIKILARADVQDIIENN